MKKLTRAASMLLAAITVSGSAATAVSADSIIKYLPGIKDYNECEICESIILSDEDYIRYKGKYYHTECREDDDDKITVKPSTVLKPTYEYVSTYAPVVEGGSIYKENGKVLVGTRPVVTVKPTIKPGIVVKPGTVVKPGVVVKPGYSTIIGGKYFTISEAKEYLAKYFETNTYTIDLKEGDTRTFQAGSYFISSDPSVAYYDYETGKIVGNDSGSADLYVCTSGGIPYFCIRVNVVNRLVNTKKESAYLKVTAEDWQLSIGEKTTLTATASDGKTYDDILYTIDFGEDNATVGARSGSFLADANGPVVVRAYSKSNPKINGEALLFVGNYKNYIYDGYWSTTDDGIWVNGWGSEDVVLDYYSYIAGWIQADEDGLLIPVVKKLEATNTDGEKTTILTGDTVDYAELLKEAYGSKGDLVSIIKKYNLYKNGLLENKVTIGDIDYSKLFLGQIFKVIE